jgi:ChrB-like protein
VVTPSREWAFLLHRLPREPSAPRIALWRAIHRLGALLLGDGLVALPAGARTIEHLEWLAAGIEEQGGSASVWVARPTTGVTTDRLVEQSRDAVDAEYRAVVRAVEAAADGEVRPIDHRRQVRRLRAELRRIGSRDFFGAASGAAARARVEGLAETKVEVGA